MARGTPTDDRLLDAAIDQFGRLGLDGASTRAIAAAAGTPMSSITYHYGSKRGLYLAAARHIADRMGERMATALAGAEAEGVEASAAVVAVVDRFAEVMLRDESAGWARFVVREQMEPTEAFDVLFDGVMGRTMRRLAGLIVGASGGRCGDAEARLRAIAVVGQALAFRVARATLLRATGWAEVDEAGAAAVRAVVRAHTAAILSDIRGETRDER